MKSLRSAFESDPHRAEQLIKVLHLIQSLFNKISFEEVDIHAVAGLLKLYLRELPECLFTSEAYSDLLKAMDLKDEAMRVVEFSSIIRKVPSYPNLTCIKYLTDHILKIGALEKQNKEWLQIQFQY